jgi:hypothetical protein
MQSLEKFPTLITSSHPDRRRHIDCAGWVENPAALPSSFSRVLIVWTGLAMAAALAASAHVKWFAQANVGEDPLAPVQVGNPLFWAATVFACFALFMASLAEQTTVGRRFTVRVGAATSTWFAPAEQILRVAVGGFFLSLWARGGVLLTPELLTDADWIAWLQLGISACMLDRRLLPLGAFGILTLYGEGVWQHGLFHMIDYVFFPGLASYLALSAAMRPKLQGARMPVLRSSLAFSLMWVSIEKFVYPHWTLCVMQQHPIITFGFEPHAVTQLAGIVEFSLAFSLLWTPLIRRAAALVLAVLMSAAILEFGKIDAIGRIIPIALLIALALDQSRLPALRHTLSPFLLCGSLGVVFTSYYAAHAML